VSHKTVYLLRHGKIATEGEKRRYIGQIDLPLNAQGMLQAERLALRLEKVGCREVYCSDLSRTRETGRIVAAKAAARLVVRPELREISLGEWEGLSFDEVARKYPGAFEARGKDLAYYRIAGGESFADCSGRIVNAFREIVERAADPVTVVGHAGINRLILCHVLGMPLTNLFRIGQDYGCLNVIQYTGNSCQLRMLNSITR
jgi:alpha-ribazole phosphatase